MKSPAFQFYPGSWLSSTDIGLMTPAEEGAYIRLLCHAWLQPDCGVQNDDCSLAILSRLGRSWPKSSAKIKAKFIERDGRLFNKRLLAERLKQQQWAEKSAKGGRHSSGPRKSTKDQGWLKGGCEMVATKPQPTTQPNANTLSLSLSLVKPTPQTQACGWEPNWSRLEQEYPGEVNPFRDCQLFISVVETPDAEANFFAGLERWKGSSKWQRGYVPTLSNFLRDHVWEVKPPDDKAEAKFPKELM
jgi:uncharacterized protein YdaU (DUF1376 family)